MVEMCYIMCQYINYIKCQYMWSTGHPLNPVTFRKTLIDCSFISLFPKQRNNTNRGPVTPGFDSVNSFQSEHLFINVLVT